MKIDRKKASHWMLLLQQGLFTLIVIMARLFAKNAGNPIVVLYGHQFSGNLKALYEQWLVSHSNTLDLYFLTLDPVLAHQLKKHKISVLSCSKLRDMLVLSRTSALISDHSLHLMAPMVYLTDILFIDVWHGIPFKGFRPADFSLQHKYDETWVTSRQLLQIYTNRFGFSADRVNDLGYARTDKLFKTGGSKGRFREYAQIPPEKKIILYAPTWQQDAKNRNPYPFGLSHDEFSRRMSKLCRSQNATMVIRSHLNSSFSGHRSQEVIYCSQRDYGDTEDLLIATDILISDWSSIVFDYIALRRPTIFIDSPPTLRKWLYTGKRI